MNARLAGIGKRAEARSPETLLLAGFVSLIVAGTALLSHPWAHAPGVRVLDAFFTATSAVCVTGLVVVDTARDFTTFGQIVILLLIQAGGIGIMSFAALAFQLLGRRLSLSAQAALADSLLQRDAGNEFRATFGRILRFVALTETIGAVSLFVGMSGTSGLAHAAYSAVFHSVSAFCNAGFSLYSDSLAGWRGNTAVISTVMTLIVLGGIGHPVVIDLWRKGAAARPHRPSTPVHLTLTSTSALVTSGALTFLGTVLLFALGLTPGETRWPTALWNSLFQSVTARTAGFNTVEIGALPPPSLLVIVILMFIGGSPGSCAGGIKTTTFALWLAGLRTCASGGKWPRLFGRHVPGEIARRASLIIGLATVWNVLGVLVLLVTESSTPGAAMDDVLFEQVSAFGTVGLSTGMTPQLSAAGRLWLIATMFVGRLGPLTLAVWAFEGRASGVRYPEARVMIG